MKEKDVKNEVENEQEVKSKEYFMEHKSLGAIPSKPDERDYHISKLIPITETFPEEYKVPNLPANPYDQNGYGMCVGFSLAEIKEVQEAKERGKNIRYSPAFIYGNRYPGDYEGEGMEPREALKNLLKDGVCKYENYPILGEYKTCKQGITETMRKEALPQKIAAYARVYNVNEIKSALMKLGPVLFCIPVYDSFYAGGDLPLPNKEKETLNGYHAIVCVGWNKNNRWIILNSWGKDWGSQHGYCTIPFDYPVEEMWSITDYINPNPQPNPQPEPQPQPSPQPEHGYKIQAGAFFAEKNANNRVITLKSNGYEFGIKKEQLLYKVISTNTYKTKEEAKNVGVEITTKLKISTYIIKV